MLRVLPNDVSLQNIRGSGRMLNKCYDRRYDEITQRNPIFVVALSGLLLNRASVR